MPREKLIVLAHPDDAMRVTYEVVLKHEGWLVLAAYTGSGALELVHENHPVLLIIDTRLPRGGCARVIRTLRTEGSKLHILALCDGGSCKEVLALGADQVEQRPVEAAYLVRLVRQIVGTG